jgi:hypothetical protein
MAYIGFIEWTHVETFLSVVAREHSEETESLYNRIVGKLMRIPYKRWAGKRLWRVQADARDLNLDFGEDNTPVVLGPPAVVLWPSVFFPASDIEEVVSRLKPGGSQPCTD